MTTENRGASNNIEHTKISLEEMANSYLDSLQRNYDMVCYTLAGSRKTNEEDYDDFSQQLQVMPRQPSRMSFDDAKKSSEQWLLRNSLADALALVMPVLEDARTVCALCDFKASGKKDHDELQQIATDQRSEFLQFEIADKFSTLKEKYQISTDVEDHILGLMELTKALMTKGGILTDEEADENGECLLKIRSVHIVQDSQPSEGGAASVNLSRRVGDSEKVFTVGQEIHFSKADHVGALLTVGIFITDVLKGVQTYAQKTGAAED